MNSQEYPKLDRRGLTLILCLIIAATLLSPALLVGAATLFERRFQRTSALAPPPAASSPKSEKKTLPHEEWQIQQLGGSVATLRSKSSVIGEVHFRFVNYLAGPSWQTTLSRALTFPEDKNQATLTLEIRADRPRTVTVSLTTDSDLGNEAPAETVPVNNEWTTHRWQVSAARSGQTYQLILGVGADAGSVDIRSVGWENSAPAP